MTPNIRTYGKRIYNYRFSRQKAVQQLKELRLEFDSTKGSYVELAKELAQGVKTNPKTFDELSQKARNYTSLLEKLNKTQENMTSIQAKQLTVLRQVSQQLNSMSSLQKLNLLFEQFAKISRMQVTCLPDYLPHPTRCLRRRIMRLKYSNSK